MKIDIYELENFDTKVKNLKNKELFIVPTKYLNKILTSKLPIKNTKIAVKNIIEFLSALDHLVTYNNSTLFPIGFEFMSEFFSKNLTKQYRELLSELGIMTRVPYEDGTFYCKNSYTSLYRVHNEYLSSDEYSIVTVTTRKKIENNFSVPTNKKYENTISKLNLKLSEAIAAEIDEHLKNNTSFHSLKSRINSIFYTTRKRYIKQGVNSKRLIHPFCNLSKISRKYFETKMYNIDIVNCQPLLLCALLKVRGLAIDENYIADCENGNFYERFVTSELPRDEVKIQLYKAVFFKFKKTKKIALEFKKLYPLTYNSLEVLSNSNVTLACQLQQIESKLFNSLVPKKSKMYFTLFDAIYFSDFVDSNELNEKIKGYFENLGISVTTQIEH